jgi:enoyl-CoA hydratase/carnithine racemase
LTGVEQTVLVEHTEGGRLATVTLSRPDVHNALNTAMAKELVRVFAELGAEPALRCVILTGSGRKAFCAGADLKQRSGMSAEAWFAQHREFEAAFASLRDFPRPVFTAANGVAAGGGLELALSTDFILSSTTARFGQPEVKVGIIPGGGAAQLLPRYLPVGLARELLMTGDLIDARRALSVGLVNSLHEPDDLLSAAGDLARRISANSPAAVRSVKAVVGDGIGRPLDEAIERGLSVYNELIDAPDRYEGVRAFNERRRPDFRD